jgi:hypothetical protein
MRNLSSLLSALALSSIVAAQTVTVPDLFANAEGGTSGNIWRAGPNRVQAIYDSTNFQSQGAGLIEINSVSFRLAGAGVTNIITYPAVEIYLQNAAVDYTAPSTTFAANRTVALPTTPNFSGPVTTTAVAGTTPNGYFITIPLTTPFLYDAFAGQDLLLEIAIVGNPAPLLGNTISTGFLLTHKANSVRSVGSSTSAVGTASLFAPLARFGYTLPAGGANNLVNGAGCITEYGTLYEAHNSTLFDQQNSAITFTPNGGGWVVTQTGTFLPVGSIATPTVLTLTDDSDTNYPFTVGSFPGWTSLQIASNCYVTNGTAPFVPATLPNLASFNAPTATGFFCWHDMDPGAVGSGAVQVEESSTVTTVTWNGVYTWNTFAANNVQFQFFATGEVTIAWGTMSLTAGNGYLVGFSRAGTNQDRGSIDISANPVLTIAAADRAPLRMRTTTRPIVGTNWGLETSSIPPNGVFGVDIFGLADPGINDLFFIGMPTCGLRATPDVIGGAWLNLGVPNLTILPLPANPALTGVSIYATSAVFESIPVNAFGAVTANGVQGVLGTF